MADIWGIEKVWRGVYQACSEHGDFASKKSTSTLRYGFGYKSPVCEKWRILSRDGGASTTILNIAVALSLGQCGECMSVQNGKVYQCVITMVLDDFVLLKYCVNNRIYIWCKNLSENDLRLFKYIIHFQAVESYYKNKWIKKNKGTCEISKTRKSCVINIIRPKMELEKYTFFWDTSY